MPGVGPQASVSAPIRKRLARVAAPTPPRSSPLPTQSATSTPPHRHLHEAPQAVAVSAPLRTRPLSAIDHLSSVMGPAAGPSSKPRNARRSSLTRAAVPILYPIRGTTL